MNMMEAGQDQTTDMEFVVHSVYVKDISFESPNTPKIFSMDWHPKLDFDLRVANKAIGNNAFEVAIDVTVKVQIELSDEDKQKITTNNENGAEKPNVVPAFLVEVVQAGIFAFNTNVEGAELPENSEKVLAVIAPNILFPYLRATISDLVTKGGFPQLVLPLMNFESLYEQKQKELAAKQQEALTELSH